ncbi:MAG: hypothetical protein PHS92_03190 [Candidatus Gracilibacteria bacterium]|nr:hypothetical protein [Candidatus Gracilibacteria bacterium]
MTQDNSTIHNPPETQENKLPENVSALIAETHKGAGDIVDFSQIKLLLKDEDNLLGLFRQFIKAVGNTVSFTLGMEQLSPEQFSVLVNARKRYSKLIEEGSADNHNAKVVNG